MSTTTMSTTTMSTTTMSTTTMSTTTMSTTKSAAFRALHAGPGLLRLPNAWDAASAALFERLGAEAIATTSAGVAWARGCRDGDRVPAGALAASVAEIARAVRAPVSVDVEGGYAAEPAAVGELIAALIDAGAVGINIEDGAEAPTLLCAKIAAAKQAAARAGVDLFVNARTDVSLRGLVPDGERVAEIARRANAYREAGADGLFVPKLVDGGQIAQVAASTPLPLNLLAWPGLPPVAELPGLGVRRLSAGSAVAQAAYARAAESARRFLEGDPGFAEGALPYAELNALF